MIVMPKVKSKANNMPLFTKLWDFREKYHSSLVGVF